ncbi:hypothetical protein WJX74_002256 [Apatococcus lobatus]|uniref:Glyceraldehyde-3-phosphate dehydrogenase n=2 Tax=Apatococcus TaxID=904362 RepID=A0AAW1T8W3_9CHLO
MAGKQPVKVGINGFGRIGRLAARYILAEVPELKLVHVNDLAAIESAAYLLKFDSVHGSWAKEGLRAENGVLEISMKDANIKVGYSSQEDPQQVPWAEQKVEIVLECTGKFLTRMKLEQYLKDSVRKVVVSAPVKDSEGILNIVLGCNQDKYQPDKDHIITAASCTTNCLGPVVKVMLDKIGIVHGCITTVHNVTNTQTIVDAPNTKKADLRRARSGLVNLAPTSTGSATAIASIFPELRDKLNGLAIRVPLINASITDIVLELKQATTVAEVNRHLQEASTTYLQDILGYEEQPLVSTDYVNDKRSSIVDAASTQVIDGTLVKIYAWYDNEYGYACRLVDIAKMAAQSIV